MNDERQLQKSRERGPRLIAKVLVLLLLLTTCWLWWDSYRNTMAFVAGQKKNVLIMSVSGRLVVASGPSGTSKPQMRFDRIRDEEGVAYRFFQEGISKTLGFHFMEFRYPWIITLVVAMYAGFLAWLHARARKIREALPGNIA